MKDLRNYVAGSWVGSAHTFDKFSPVHGRKIATVHEASRALVDKAVAAGHPAGCLREDFTVDHRVAKQHHQPLARANEFGLACAPTHALGDR